MFFIPFSFSRPRYTCMHFVQNADDALQFQICKSHLENIRFISGIIWVLYEKWAKECPICCDLLLTRLLSLFHSEGRAVWSVVQIVSLRGRSPAVRGPYPKCPFKNTAAWVQKTPYHYIKPSYHYINPHIFIENLISSWNPISFQHLIVPIFLQSHPVVIPSQYPIEWEIVFLRRRLAVI